MISITNGLPDTVMVDGEPYFLNTDFRAWLKFDEFLKNPEEFYLTDWEKLFTGQAPEPSPAVLQALIEFFSCSDRYPVGDGGGAETVSYADDMGYIYADFLSRYGIDLLDAEMHWHKFVALFRGLMTDMSSIVSYRAYTGSDKDMLKLQAQWRIQLDAPLSQEAVQIRDALENGRDITEIMNNINGG